MIFQYHLTKFCILSALTKRAEEVAFNLVDIFAMFGTPSILQSDNGREFTNDIIGNLIFAMFGAPSILQSDNGREFTNDIIGNL